MLPVWSWMWYGSVLLRSLNEVSAFIWAQLQQETTEDAVLDAILEEFDVDLEIAVKDLESLLDSFAEMGLLEA